MSQRGSAGAEGRPLPYGVYRGIGVGLCLAGLGVSAYLAFSHYRVHADPGYQSFCALSKAINCDTVSQSPYSVWWGLPLAVWGMAAYSLLTLLVIFAGRDPARKRRLWTILFIIAFSCSLISIGFAGVSAFLIGSWCILCIATYGINFLLAFFGWIIRKRFHVEPLATGLKNDLRFLWANARVAGPLFGLLVGALLMAFLFLPAYWELRHSDPSASIRSGMTEDGLPWIGAENPLLEIVEFTDYQCFQCRKMHHHMLQLTRRHPEKIRLLHRHFPMDHEFNPIVGQPFHVGSGRMAILAIHAAQKGKFTEMNEWLFFKVAKGESSINLADAAAATGMDARELSAALQHAPYRLLLKRDIHQGLRLGIVGTPSYVVNGQVYEGNLPPEVLRPLFQAAGTD